MPNKSKKSPLIVDVPVVMGVYFAIISFACLVTFITQGFLLLALWLFLAAIAVAAILAIPLVLSNGVSHRRVAKSEQNDLLREIAHQPSATLRHAEAQMLATYITAVDLKSRLETVDSESPADQRALADLQATLDRITARMEPLSTQVEHELQKAKTEALRNRLLLAVELIRQQLIPYSAHKLGHERSLWRSSQEAGAKVAARLQTLSGFEAWDEQVKAVLGFEQLRATQQQFAQLGEWPQGPAPGVVLKSGVTSDTGLYEYTKMLKEAEKSLDRWRRTLEGDQALDD